MLKTIGPAPHISNQWAHRKGSDDRGQQASMSMRGKMTANRNANLFQHVRSQRAMRTFPAVLSML